VTKYFAYGSNMSAAVMNAECMGSRFLGRAHLPRHRLAFTRRSVRTGTGVADVLPDGDSTVWGALYSLTTEDLGSLDRKEGSGWAYERRSLHVVTDDGAAHEAVVYVVITKAVEPVAPSPGYMQRLIDAGRERGLPGTYLAAIERGPGSAGTWVADVDRPRAKP